MSDLAPQSELAPRTRDAAAPFGCAPMLVEQWGAVEDAARVVAMLAGRAAPVEDHQGTARIGLLAHSHADQARAASSALSDLVATMRAGLGALLAAQGSSANTRQAATRLWHEYERGRVQVLAEVQCALRGQHAAA